MSEPQVVTRDVWRRARLELLAREKEATRMLAEVGAARQALPMVEVDKEYLLEGPDGRVRLLDLFEGRGQLIVYHFMFDPAWDAGCEFCSYLVDNLGDRSHLHARNTTVALVSRAPISKIEAFRSRMGWAVPWYSAYDSDFNYDFHVTQDEEITPVEYDYRDKGALLQDGEMWLARGEQAGLSVFVRRADSVHHTYSAYGAGTDLLLGTDNYLALTPQGRPLPGEKGKWLRHHDRYEP